jgi:hypothetical protein
MAADTNPHRRMMLFKFAFLDKGVDFVNEVLVVKVD